MSKFYMLFLPPSEVYESLSYDWSQFTLHHPSAHYLQEDDRILIVCITPKAVVLPSVFTVVKLKSGTNVLLQLKEKYNQPVSLQTAAKIILSTPPEEAKQRDVHEEIVAYADWTSDNSELIRDSLSKRNIQIITGYEFRNIIKEMAGKGMEEQVFLDHVQRYISARGFYFDNEVLYNYHICLKTRPFVILAGLSGTGKSKLTQLYAEALGHKNHYLRLSVRPNWNDDHYLLGHLNTITGEYFTEPAVDFVLKAGDDVENLYFFCLDEMNLAHVEYYFSQFLSAMEEEHLADRRISLISKHTQQRLLAQHEESDIPSEICIPPNLYFAGTINMDETTQPISDKVIDRANTLEFFDVDLEKFPKPQQSVDPIPTSALTWQHYKVREPDTSRRNQIIEISKILNKADIGLGYRVLREIELYLANSKNLFAPDVAFDLQIKQRILPRVRGTEAISDILVELLNFMKQQNLPRSYRRLEEMKRRLKRDGYTGFWR